MILHILRQWLVQNINQCLNHKRHPISRPNGWAMGCQEIGEKTDHIIMARPYICISEPVIIGFPYGWSPIYYQAITCTYADLLVTYADLLVTTQSSLITWWSNITQYFILTCNGKGRIYWWLCSISSASAMEILQSCTEPSIYQYLKSQNISHILFWQVKCRASPMFWRTLDML